MVITSCPLPQNEAERLNTLVSFQPEFTPLHGQFSAGANKHGEQRTWGALRTLNHDRWKHSFGFGMHTHENMEIISYVVSGELAHKDSLGNARTLRQGEVQLMSSGVGITHSEYNASATHPLEFVQIWIDPKYAGLPPTYEHRKFMGDDTHGRLILLASSDRREGSLKLWQDANLYAARLTACEMIEIEFGTHRIAYVYVIRGALDVNGVRILAGESARIKDEPRIVLSADDSAELILFEGVAAEPRGLRLR